MAENKWVMEGRRSMICVRTGNFLFFVRFPSKKRILTSHFFAEITPSPLPEALRQYLLSLWDDWRFKGCVVSGEFRMSGSELDEQSLWWKHLASICFVRWIFLQSRWFLVWNLFFQASNMQIQVNNLLSSLFILRSLKLRNKRLE